MDTLEIVDLELSTRIGITEEERAKPQRILVNLSFTFDARETAKKDELEGTTDYAALVDAVKKEAATQRRTIERLAEDIATLVLSFPGIHAAKVTVTKYPLPSVREIRLTIERAKDVSLPPQTSMQKRTCRTPPGSCGTFGQISASPMSTGRRRRKGKNKLTS